MDLSDTPPAALQFDAVVPRESGAPGDSAGMACKVCQARLADEYFDVNGNPICRDCSNTVVSQAETPRGVGVLARAAALGAVGAVLGAALYFLVLVVTGWQVGLVAIAIGFMVGFGVRLGTQGRGGRRFQVLAVVLTYWAVGLAYSSLVIKEMVAGPATEQGATAAPAADAPAALEADAASDGSEGEGASLAVSLLMMLAFTFALPVLVIVQSLPGGILSAVIIVFGMMQAWRMTAAPQIQVLGPFRIGAAPAATGG